MVPSYHWHGPESAWCPAGQGGPAWWWSSRSGTRLGCGWWWTTTTRSCLMLYLCPIEWWRSWSISLPTWWGSSWLPWRTMFCPDRTRTDTSARWRWGTASWGSAGRWTGEVGGGCTSVQKYLINATYYWYNLYTEVEAWLTDYILVRTRILSSIWECFAKLTWLLLRCGRGCERKERSNRDYGIKRKRETCACND